MPASHQIPTIFLADACQVPTKSLKETFKLTAITSPAYYHSIKLLLDSYLPDSNQFPSRFLPGSTNRLPDSHHRLQRLLADFCQIPIRFLTISCRFIPNPMPGSYHIPTRSLQESYEILSRFLSELYRPVMTLFRMDSYQSPARHLQDTYQSHASFPPDSYHIPSRCMPGSHQVSKRNLQAYSHNLTSLLSYSH